MPQIFARDYFLKAESLNLYAMNLQATLRLQNLKIHEHSNVCNNFLETANHCLLQHNSFTWNNF